MQKKNQAIRHVRTSACHLPFPTCLVGLIRWRTESAILGFLINKVTLYHGFRHGTHVHDTPETPLEES